MFSNSRSLPCELYIRSVLRHTEGFRFTVRSFCFHLKHCTLELALTASPDSLGSLLMLCSRNQPRNQLSITVYTKIEGRESVFHFSDVGPNSVFPALKEQLRSLSLFSIEETEGRLHISLQLSHAGTGGKGSDLFGDSNRTRENDVKLHQSRVRLGVTKRFFPRSWSALQEASKGNGQSTKLLEFKEHLDSTLRHGILVWVVLCGGAGHYGPCGSLPV